MKRERDSMALSSEDLLVLSNMMDQKLKPIKEDVKDVKLLIENDVLPRIQNIESCYTSTHRKQASGIQEMEALKADMEIVKKVVAEHSDYNLSFALNSFI